MGRAPCCDKANVKRGPWSPEEDTTLKNYVHSYGTGGNWIALPHKAGKVISLNNNITTNYTIHPSATPSPVSLTKSENCHNGFSACLNTNSSTLSSSKEASYGQNVDLQRLVADPIHFVLPGCSEMSEFARSSNNNYSTFSSSQDVSSLSGSSSLALDNNYISWSSNGSGVDDGFLMDFGYETPYDILNCFGFQEKPSEIVPN
ncbi:hypothetical protein HHK36_006252 [Tetracentron sinense]|uniref:Uncharacterized protein n=1 Tax=Tetracentron sinense TaxID=13715 RepID=A0A834ZII8_TETSI|nr:hypothetical protein HHK36_006252 [Tetracentron sinense]